MEAPDLNVKIVVKVRGMWKLAIITFLMRHKSIRHTVHVHLNDGKKAQCITHDSTNEKVSGIDTAPKQGSTPS